jgi:DNA-directed RNA polymerase III subunit RPC1
MLTPAQRLQFLNELRRPNLSSVHREAIIKRVTEACRKVRRCPSCGSINGPVKKMNPLRIIHERYKSSPGLLMHKTQFERTFDYAISVNHDIHKYLPRAIDNIDAQTALKLFNMIPPQDYPLLGVPKGSKPTNYIWQNIPVPPSCIRPTVQQEGGSTNEDDLTADLSTLVSYNARLLDALVNKIDTIQIILRWDMLAVCAGLYINSTAPGLATGSGDKPSRSFTQRLKGKQGRFRGNLSGKRVDFSGRTVISPDPNLKIDEVAVPDRVAMIMTYPERVNVHNKKALQEAILRGHDKHPGAIAVTFANGSKKYPPPSLHVN